jgi:hypothetical protein
LIEVMPAVKIMDRPNIDARLCCVDDELGKAACLDLSTTGTDKCDKVMGMVRTASVQTLLPEIRQPSSVFRARLRTAAKSEPESGSLIPMPKKQVPAAIRGRIVDLARSEPCLSIW